MQPLVACGFVAACSLWNIAGLLAIRRATRPSPSTEARPQPVSVLKPLRGADSGLYRNLRSFFEQRHAEVELVFGVTDPTMRHSQP